ncbi:FAD-dependent oxidoreductase [Massilia glaciei]|uniref:Pyridine nucleotide-disulfide oxidoreductase n=1 Tax=Massilia glaciei TaxID=1524097 RepID=A0A2U2HGM7_9BURK|nr:FAD-dependent oxidoreductase [Massilia glaciei]PWF44032.1 pyridine nucleotide-disulfide oxidoreductase [Massilia glaciei]
MKRLVLVGAGHAHARVLRDFARDAPHGIALTLVSPAPLAPYSGMVPGWMAGHYRWDECCIDFARLCRLAGATLRIGMAARIDAAGSVLHLESGEQLDYDVLSLDIGSTAYPPEGAGPQLLPMRPLSRLNERWETLREHVRALPPGAACSVLVVGGGAAGVESVLAAKHQLAEWAPHVAFGYALATQGKAALPALARSAARKIGAHFERHGIRVIHDFEAARLDHAGVASRDGRTLAADVVLWATGAKAHGWPAAAGIAQDSAGFIKVDSDLRSVSHPNIFAAGDCASFAVAVPKAGVFAVRMGPVLAHNLRALLGGRPLEKFVAQKRHLVLLGTGGEHAVAAWGPLSWQGRWVWRWKRRIDQRFLARHNGAVQIN